MSETQTELCYLTIREAASLIKSRKLSPVELTRAFLNRIQEVDGQLKSYVTLLPDAALEEARVAEAEILRGRYRGPLHGIPVAHKDQYDTKGIPTATRPKDSPNYSPLKDATAVLRLRKAGSVLLGKLAMSGVAVGTDMAAARDQARNPWNLNYMPGGSSSGSGAAVAAGLCMGSLGEDTGGSIRTPAAMCGVVGLKPTYGRISRFGLAPLSWSLDHCGPLTRTVENTATMLQFVAGYDSKDATSSRTPVPDYLVSLRDNLKGIVVGVPRVSIVDPKLGIEPETMAAFDKALADLEGLGASLVEIDNPSLEYATIANTVIWYSETLASRKKDLQLRPEIFGERFRLRLELGCFFSAEEYVRAQRVRTSVKKAFADIFRRVNVLAVPTLPKPAPAVKDFNPRAGPEKDMIPNFLAPFNLTGVPAISIPCGFTKGGLPLGLQIVGKPFDESTVLRVAYAYEQHTGWHTSHPPI